MAPRQLRPTGGSPHPSPVGCEHNKWIFATISTLTRTRWISSTISRHPKMESLPPLFFWAPNKGLRQSAWQGATSRRCARPSLRWWPRTCWWPSWWSPCSWWPSRTTTTSGVRWPGARYSSLVSTRYCYTLDIGNFTSSRLFIHVVPLWYCDRKRFQWLFRLRFTIYASHLWDTKTCYNNSLYNSVDGGCYF